MKRTFAIVLTVTDHADKTEQILDRLLNSSADKIFVITGRNAEQVKIKDKSKNVELVFNNNWKEGISSYIKCGVNKAVSNEPGTDGIILISVENQSADSKLINELIDTHLKRGKPIITSPGATLFHQSMFPELLQLTGDNGPDHIINIHEGNTISI